MASFALRGGCHCGRNHYVVQPPADLTGSTSLARLLFTPEPTHQSSLGSPLPAYLQIPLSWYHSGTTAYFDDETSAMIHRVYEPVSARSAPLTQRRFCGFCGTPLSFWSDGRHEAGSICVAVGSLHADDLNRLDEWIGMDGDESADSSDSSDSSPGADRSEGDAGDEQDTSGRKDTKDAPVALGSGPGVTSKINIAIQPAALRGGAAPVVPSITSVTGLPWLDRFVEGSRLSRLLHRQLLPAKHTAHIRRHDTGSATSADGSTRIEWEVVEWTEGDQGDDDNSDGNSPSSYKHGATDQPSPSKRQKHSSEADD